MTKTKEQLTIENEELHSRLAETEEVLYAIRNGDVDAIVIPGNLGDQIYSISSAETPYRTFIERMNEGAVTLSKKGIIIYCNQRFAEMVNEPIERVIGSPLKRFIIPNDRSQFEKLFARQTFNKNNILSVTSINSISLKLSFQLLPAYLKGNYCVLVATDISEMKKNEKKLFEASRVLEQKLDIIQRLRMQIIDKKIDLGIEINNLKKSNNKLSKEITRRKQIEAELKQKIKRNKTI